MLEHLNADPLTPKRVVIMGAGGFVGGNAGRCLEAHGVPVTALTRTEVDLLADGAAVRLASEIDPATTLIVVSARAPCKDNTMLRDNIGMMAVICEALVASRPAHVIYISSDAVYADSKAPLSEASPAEPDSLHGVMHLTREVMLKIDCPDNLAILRPTLLYGADDPHNGYGPNRFRRLSDEGSDIVLFGEGEEQRDHVLIDDLAEIIRLAVMHKSRGVLNVATGTVTSFFDIAGMVVALFDAPPAIKNSPRQGPMPHGGYRAFDNTACKTAFPDFSYTPLAEGLAITHTRMMERSDR